MPISSMLVEVEPETEADVSRCLTAMGGVTVQATGGGRIVVVTDTASLEADRDLTAAIREVPHVTHANVVFTNVEDCLPVTEVKHRG